MKSLVLRVIAIIGLVGLFASGNALASSELVMQKVITDAPVQLASGSHNPCGYDHDKAHSKSKDHGNPCNPCGDAHNACNPCGANPCAANPCGHAALEDGRIILAGHHEAGENPCNPCAANPCNPCAANPCNPCGANPCAANACNPCAKSH